MKKTTGQILHKAHEICHNLLMVANSEHSLKLRSIMFRVSSRMTSAAGTARISNSVISLSLPYFEDSENFENHLQNTITHEIAHVLAPPTRSLGSRKRDVHGAAWKAAHIALGGTGETYHSMDLAIGHTRRQRKPRTQITCGCGCGSPMTLGPTQLKKHLSGKAKYCLKGHVF